MDSKKIHDFLRESFDDICNSFDATMQNIIDNLEGKIQDIKSITLARPGAATNLNKKD